MNAKKAVTKRARKHAAVVSFDDPELAGGGAVVPTRKEAKRGKGRNTGDPGPERGEAFYSEGFEWNGKKLVGLTSGRVGVFLEMRAGVTSLPFLDSLGGDGWFSDSIRILYFCATVEADWREFRRDAMAWQEEIERWGSENVEAADRILVEGLAFDIWKQSQVNRHEIQPAAKGAGGEGK